MLYLDTSLVVLSVTVIPGSKAWFAFTPGFCSQTQACTSRLLELPPYRFIVVGRCELMCHRLGKHSQLSETTPGDNLLDQAASGFWNRWTTLEGVLTYLMPARSCLSWTLSTRFLGACLNSSNHYFSWLGIPQILKPLLQILMVL